MAVEYKKAILIGDSHTELTDVGTNTHDEIDTHIADSTIHFTTPIEEGSAAGQMAFWNGTQWKHTEDTELFWDDANKRIGLGTSGPEGFIHGVTNSATTIYLESTSTGGGGMAGVRLDSNDPVQEYIISNENAYNNILLFRDVTNTQDMATFSSSVVIFNYDGADQDFRVEGDTDANLLFVDAGEDRIGIGTATPGAKLDVRGSAIFNEAGGDYDFRIEGYTDPNLFNLDASGDKINLGDVDFYAGKKIYFEKAMTVPMQVYYDNDFRCNKSIYPAGYKSSDGSIGGTADILVSTPFGSTTLHFKNGIFINNT